MRENWRVRRTVVWCVIALVCGAGGILYFYRGFFGEPMMLQGDIGDGALTMFISGHWSAGVPGGDVWRDLGIYFPAKYTLGYSDTMFLSGVLEWPMKYLGVGEAARFQASLVALSAIGNASAILLFRIGPKVSWPLAIVGAMTFAFGSGIYIASGHPQLLALNFLPAVGLLAIGARRWRSWRGIAAAAGCGLLIALVAYSAFYIGWFTLIGGGLLVVMTLLLRGLAGRGIRPPRVALPRLAGFISGFLVGLVPFAYTYGPVLAQGRGRAVTAVVGYALTPAELANVGPGNVVWGRLLSSRGLVQAEHLVNSEFQMAPTPLLVVFAVVLAIWGFRARRRLTAWGHLALGSVAAGIVFWIAPVHLGSFFPWGMSLYRLPGGSAVRAIGRVELLAGALLVFGVVVLVDAWLKQVSARRVVAARVVVSAALLVIVLEQIQLTPMQRLPAAILESLAEVPHPPGECRSFVLTRSLSDADPPYAAQTEAAVVSQRVGIPTWNGYSGFEPRGWDLYYVAGPAYPRNIREWGRSTGVLADACGLDLESGHWLDPRALRSFTAGADGSRR